jgi:hypothetical protein
MSKSLRNCANCIYGSSTDGNMLWCTYGIGKGVWFNAVCSKWEHDDIPYSERVEDDE